MLDDVVGMLALARIVNAKGGRAWKLRPRSWGVSPDAGESHFALPSDCLARSCRDGTFDVGDKVCDAEREGCAQLVAEWSRP